MSRGGDFDQVVGQEFGKLRDAMADDVMKQLAWKLADPMVPVAKHWANVTTVPEFIGPMAFQMDRLATEKPFLHEPAHFEHLQRELIIVARGHLQAAFVGKRASNSVSRCGDSERLFEIDMASRLPDTVWQGRSGLAAEFVMWTTSGFAA